MQQPAKVLILTLAIGLIGPFSSFAATQQDEIASISSVLSISDQKTLSESIALVRTLSDEVQRSKSSALIERMQKTIDTQRDFQAEMIGMAKGVLSVNEFIEITASISSSEIAMHTTQNPRYVQFQSREGSEFDMHEGVPAMEAKVKLDMESGGRDNIVGNPMAQKAVIRRRAALIMFCDPKSPIEEKFFAAKYLTSEGGALSQR